MRDAAREPADRLHLLRLPQLLLELPLAREVADDGDVPARTDVRRRGELDQANRLVRPLQT